MRKNLKSKVLLSILAASVFYLPAYANAASLTINDDKITASDSVVDDWYIDKLISHRSSLQNNTITISNKEYNNLQQIFGAYATQIGNTDRSHTNLQDNNVSIEANTFSALTDIGGACAEFNNNNNTTVSFNSTASLQDNSVTISGSTFNFITTITGAFGRLYSVYLNGNQTKPTIEFRGNKVTIGSGTSFTYTTDIYGSNTSLWQPVDKLKATYYNMSAALTGNSVTINDGAKFKGETTINGAYANLNNSLSSKNSSANCMASLTNNSVNINGGTFGDSTPDNNPAINIRGAYINLHNVRDGVDNYGKIASTVTGNSVTISGGEFNAATNVYGAYANLTYQPDESQTTALYYHGTAAMTDNTVTLKSTASDSLTNLNLYGYGYNETTKDVKPNDQITNHSNNNLIVDGWSGTVGSVNNFDAIDFENIKVSKSDDEKAESVFYIEASGDNNKGLADTTVNINSIDTSNYNKGDTVSGTLTLDSDIDTAKIKTNISNFSYQDNGDNGLIAETLSGLTVSTDSQTSNHIITISATVGDTVLAGKLMDANGTVHTNSNGEASLTVNEDLSNTNASVIAGAYATASSTEGMQNDATGGKLTLTTGSKFKDGTNLYAGYAENGTASGNTMTLTGTADVSNVNLFGGGSGSNGDVSSNTLTVNDWTGSVNSLQNFKTIEFENIAWKPDATVLTVAANGAALSGTAINLNSIYLAGGQTFNTGEKMTLITGTETNKLAITKDNVTAPEDLSYLAGVAVKGTGEATVDENGTVTYTITSVELTPQTDIVAETRAASAAFVNQGTDLINDSLDVLGRDGTYGVKTFAAVQGNRSSYDVADDLKINGWSVIAGFGAENEHKGGDFAWGVFYENGSGNYRTYNTFNSTKTAAATTARTTPLTTSSSAATAAWFTTAAALRQGTRTPKAFIRKVRSVPVC